MCSVAAVGVTSCPWPQTGRDVGSLRWAFAPGGPVPIRDSQGGCENPGKAFPVVLGAGKQQPLARLSALVLPYGAKAFTWRRKDNEKQ